VFVSVGVDDKWYKVKTKDLALTSEEISRNFLVVHICKTND